MYIKTLLLQQCNYELVIFVIVLLFENFIYSLTNPAAAKLAYHLSKRDKCD